MEPHITRKEFVERFLPKRRSIQTAFQVLKYGIYVFLTYFAIRILFAVPVAGWALLGLILITFLLIGLLATLYKRKKQNLIERKSVHVLPALLAIEKTLSIATYMAVGIILYRTWLREPYEAYIILAIWGLVTLRDEYERHSETSSACKEG